MDKYGLLRIRLAYKYIQTLNRCFRVTLQNGAKNSFSDNFRCFHIIKSVMVTWSELTRIGSGLNWIWSDL